MGKIGVLIHLRVDTDLDAEFHRAAEMHLTACQLCCWDTALYTRENAELAKKASAAHGALGRLERTEGVEFHLWSFHLGAGATRLS